MRPHSKIIPIFPLEITKGNDFGMVFIFKRKIRDTVTLTDLTGYSAISQIRASENPDSELLAEFTVTFSTVDPTSSDPENDSDPVLSQVNLSLSDEQTAEISVKTGWWDLLLTSAEGWDRTPFMVLFCS